MTLQQFLAAATLGTLIAAGTPALAQHKHGAAAPAQPGADAALADGEIRRIDAAKGTVVIKHGEIKSIQMGAMTMGFKLKDAAQATGLQVGDKVKFAVEAQGDLLVVTRIEKAR